MAFVSGGKEPLFNNDTYLFHLKHRGAPQNGISTWIVNCQEEYDLADNALQNGYVEETETKPIAYNLSKDKALKIIGQRKKDSKMLELKLAKFVNSNPQEWHGYPADHMSNSQDRPSDETLNKLYKNNIIDKTDMNRLLRGKKL